jgi:hypothetical protein
MSLFLCGLRYIPYGVHTETVVVQYADLDLNTSTNAVPGTTAPSTPDAFGSLLGAMALMLGKGGG